MPSRRAPLARLPDPASLERPWLAAYPPGVPPVYRAPRVALTRFLDDAARDFPEHVGLVAGDRRLDHVTVRDRVLQVARALGRSGVTAGDRVLVALPNDLAAPIVLLAIWRLGAIAVPLDPHTRPARLAAVAEDADPAAAVLAREPLQALRRQGRLPDLAVLVTGDQWPRRRRLPRLARLAGAPGRSVRARWRARATTAPGALRTARVGPSSDEISPGAHRAEGVGVTTLAALLAAEAADREAEPGPSGAGGGLPDEPDADAPAVLAYRPRSAQLRGVVLSHANLTANAFQGRLWVPDIQAGRERVLVADPLHLTVPLTLGLLTGLLAAATVILLDEPSAEQLARAIDDHAPTLLPTVPARLDALANDRDAATYDLSSLRVCVTGGAPLEPRVAAELERRSGGARVREGFGLAEASPLTHAQPVYGRVEPGSMGLPVTGTAAIVVDADQRSRVLGPDEPGVLLVAGPQITAGYWRRPKATAAALIDGWLITDDLVRVDAAGVFTHVGRVGEVVRRYGVLVSPHHVEAVLERHPSVRRAGVVDGGPSGPCGETPLLLAAVETRRRHRPTSDELRTHCRAHLELPAVPDHVTLVTELPETDVGELARDQLRRDLAGR